MSLTKESLILIGRAYIARDCYSLLLGLVCKGKIKNKMFKKNVKGMQQNIKAGVLASVTAAMVETSTFLTFLTRSCFQAKNTNSIFSVKNDHLVSLLPYTND